MVCCEESPKNTLTRFRSSSAILLALVGLLSLGGCGRGGHLYSPHSLPPELQVRKAENAQTIDLSKLATVSINNEQIDRGDVLNVAIAAGYGTEKVDNMPVRVGDDGIANIPIVGRLVLAGLELQTAEQAIATAAVERGFYRNPSVTVTMNKRRTNKITVIGAVEKPDVYELPRGASTLLAAIVAAGNLSKEAGTDVEIRRPAQAGVSEQDRVAGRAQLTGYSPGQSGAAATVAQPASFKINLVAAAQQGDGGPLLQDGDVVRVERRDNVPVRVMGLVMKPGEFEVPVNQDMHLLDVIAKAGGVSLNVADKIHVIRRVPGKEEPVVIETSLKNAKAGGLSNLRLAPGDVVSVEETPATVVMDTIRTFFRVGFSSALPGL
jgi:polysaccharide biosynthesis/export protein